MRDACRVIAINDAYTLLPFADVLYFADNRWYQWHKDRPAFRAFRGEKVSIENCNLWIDDPHVATLRNLSLTGGTMGKLSTNPSGIHTGRNSGYQAINVAYLRGALTIVLLGYDMRNSDDDRSHFFGEHPNRKSDPATYRQFRQEFKRMAVTAYNMGIDILNATPGSELEAFPMVSLESMVAD
jgi:hypothetical protein